MTGGAKLIDAHTHIHFAAFKDDADAVIRRALDEGIGMILVGTQRDTSANAVAFAERYDGVWATVGLHPIHTEVSHHDAQELGEAHRGAGGFTSRGEDFDHEYYKKLAGHPKVVGIGECGLDYYRLGEETKKVQHEVFARQLELSREIRKPLMIHCRNAFGDLIAMLAPRVAPGGAPGVIHFFSGTAADAERLLDLGFSFTFGGVVTFAREYDAAIRFIPLDRILVETDAPYVAPAPYRGKRNEPRYVAEVVRKIAEIKNEPYERVAAATVRNAAKVFGLAI